MPDSFEFFRLFIHPCSRLVNGWGEGVQSRRRSRDGGSFLGKFGLLTFSPLLVFFCLVRVERQVQAEQDREWIIHEKTEIVIFVLNSN